MAEARREEEEGERRDLRDTSRTTDRPERTKPEHLHSNPGPLSSIRAAIKRTKTNSQSDNTRDRRRPEITIISAEPLASNNWFSGTSVVFPPPQSGWSAGIPAISQPPPSYDQVIKEKTKEEHVVKPTAAPRRTTCTTTSATQTEPVREDAANTIPQRTATPPSAEKRSAGKKPEKPPRPSLPKPADSKPAAETNGKVATNTAHAVYQGDSTSDVKQLEEADSTLACTRCITVHWDSPTNHPFVSAAPTEATSSSSNSEQTQCPIPRPRTKSKKLTADEEEAKVQTLVTLSENCDNIQFDTQEVDSSKYLKELLEVFSVESGENGHQSDEVSQGENAIGEMNTNSSQSDIRARIQAFESQAGSGEGNAFESTKPEPRPRKAINKPPVAAKPSAALKPQFTHSEDDIYQNIPATNIYQNPTPAPRPQPPKKLAALSIKEELETLHSMGAAPHRSRPSLLTRANSIHEEEMSPLPPTPPVKPSKEPLKPNMNINNHNSASVFTGNEYVDSPTKSIPVKPQRNVDSNGGTFPRQSITRRPTTIRVPSQTGPNNFQDSPPPLPAQKPIGSLNTSVSHRPSLTSSLSLQEFGPQPSLPPRKPSVNKTLPPRPPPAKTGPGRPPPPSLQATGRSHSAPWEVSPTPMAQGPQRKVLPPRPNPGHRLYNKYTFQLPHAIASFDHNGTNTGELSFQKNEVLLLLKEINQNEFECQVGETRGRVNRSYMKIITPLDSDMSTIQGASQAASGGDSSGLKVQAVHDFTPEGPGELGLRAGDVVTMVEKVDSEWYKGTCKGSAGFFPINYVKVLSNSPKPLPERKARPPSATVSGPRCVARFDFEGEHSDELSFSEGDVIQLKEFVGDDWARGQIGVFTGIFPLNFVEIIEDLPPPPRQQRSTRIPLPGMVAIASSTHPEVAKPAQASQSSDEWVVALYDYAGKSDDDLSFQQGDRILITQHVDTEWCCGKLRGNEGMFPKAFVESTGQQLSNKQQSAAAGEMRARALFGFTSDCDEELSLQVGDIVTNLESIDDEWFLGDLRGKRALVPKNYVQVL